MTAMRAWTGLAVVLAIVAVALLLQLNASSLKADLIYGGF